MKRKIYIAALTLLCLNFSGLLFAKSEFPCWVSPKKDKINLRSGPNTSDEVLMQVAQGVKLEAVAEKYGWYKVRLPEGSSGYVHKKYVARRDGQGIVEADRLNVRSRPNTNASILCQLEKGAALNILDETGEWYKISIGQIGFAWVNANVVSPCSPGKQTTVVMPQPNVVYYPIAQTEKSAPELPEDKELTSALGIVEDAGRLFSFRHVFKLVEQDKTIYYLKSDTLDLSAYIYQPVRLWGKVLPQKARYPLLEVKKIELQRLAAP
jgi:SH3-like domain-containing protein